MARLVLSLAAVIAFAGCSKKSADGDKDKTAAPPRNEDPGRVGVKGGGSGSSGTGSPTPDLKQHSRGLLDLDGDLEIAAGNIDKDVVKKVVKENTGKLQFCYEKTLLANPGIEGKVIATFTIAAEGSVSDVKAAGVHPEVESCVVECVKAFKFPPSGKKVDVQYPFNFKPA